MKETNKKKYEGRNVGTIWFLWFPMSKHLMTSMAGSTHYSCFFVVPIMEFILFLFWNTIKVSIFLIISFKSLIMGNYVRNNDQRRFFLATGIDPIILFIKVNCRMQDVGM